MSSRITMPKLAVFGGNGYVGSHVVKAALSAGLEVTVINRSGQPRHLQHLSSAHWVQSDVFDVERWRDHVKSCDAIVACIGGFGSNEAMERINGDANIFAMVEAKKLGVGRFVFVSAVENNLPDSFLRGYFHGKRRAEATLRSEFPQTGFILRPGFISGSRAVTLPLTDLTLHLPLGLFALPLQLICGLPFVRTLRQTVPGMLAILAEPVDVRQVGAVAVKASQGRIDAALLKEPAVLTIDDIKREAASETL